MSEADRDAGNRKIKAAFLLLVAVSPPLIVLQFDPSPLELLAALGVGVVLGVAVVWYLGKLAAEFTGNTRRPPRRR
ncbi:hypothetical protein [Halorubrum sp. DTA46]|uniref:hypothetical protein n=1 Tax=Halorubrum sp. DTA46 TaxID=3402162 RepID=UPI003AAA286D